MFAACAPHRYCELSSPCTAARRPSGGLRVDGNRGIIPPAKRPRCNVIYSETRMSVVECDVPSESALGKTLIERADFSDAYRAPLRRPEAGVVEIFFAIFAHR